MIFGVQVDDLRCTGGCDMDEDVDHLFVRCSYYEKIWFLLSLWLGFVTVNLGTLSDHVWHFTCMTYFSKNVRKNIHIIWLSCVWIVWKKKTNFSAQRITCKFSVIKLSFNRVGG